MRASRIFLLAVGLAAGLARAEDGPAAKPVALVSTPAAVQTTVLRLVGKGTLRELVAADENGEAGYEVNFTKPDGAERDFTVADDGTLLSRETALAEVPAAVQKTIHDEAPGWTLEELDENMAADDRSYDVAVSKDGVEKFFSVDLAGELESREVPLAGAPAAVQAAITNEAPGGTVESIDENIDPDGNSFDVEAVAKNGAKRSFSVTPDGKLLSREVKLGALPPDVRRTIRLQIGAGKVLRVDKELRDKVDGVLPYYVTGRKDGLPYDFLVGPRGRFLGMDE